MHSRTLWPSNLWMNQAFIEEALSLRNSEPRLLENLTTLHTTAEFVSGLPDSLRHFYRLAVSSSDRIEIRSSEINGKFKLL
jgi:hypothetical protein